MRRTTRSGIRLAHMVCAAAVLNGAPTTGRAQVLPPVHADVQKLEFLVGEWEGEGWYEQVPGQRSEFRGVERVERRMGGRLLTVEGSFTAWMGPDLGDVPVHQAFGVFGYDRSTERVVFRTYTAHGAAGAAVQTTEIGDDRIVWGYDDPQLGTVRYTIEAAEGVWREKGEATSDGGASWRQFFSMTLRRR